MFESTDRCRLSYQVEKSLQFSGCEWEERGRIVVEEYETRTVRSDGRKEVCVRREGAD